jgi:hypothetical protein
MNTKFWSGNLKERDHSEDLGIDGKIILEWILGKWTVDWMHLAQDRDQWRAFVNKVMNPEVS